MEAMRYFVAVTDDSWYHHLADLQPEEVNFWQPKGGRTFQAVPPGSPFLFKLHSPNDYIAGGGFFLKFETLPLSLAWEAFGEKNGAQDHGTFLGMVRRLRRDSSLNPEVGCIVLANPFFFAEEDWIPIPGDWHRNIVRGRTYDTLSPKGADLWRRVGELLLADRPDMGTDLLEEAAFADQDRFASLYLARARLGQGAFRVLVTSAYERRCAVTGEKVLPTLEAAHIRPYAEQGPNRVSNGLLLRSDFHRLFDRGYITLTPELHVEVSRSLREEFHNGDEYYAFHGHKPVQLPAATSDRPAREFLEWHNEKVFLAS